MEYYHYYTHRRTSQYFFENLVIFASIIDIIAWVFLWEAVDLYVLQRPKIEMEELRDYEMANALITFNENKGSVESDGVLWGRQNKKLQNLMGSTIRNQS